MATVPYITREDAQQLKDYVKGPDKGGLHQAESTIMLHVSHSNLKQKFIEIRLDLHVSDVLDIVIHILHAHCCKCPEGVQIMNVSA